MAVQQLEQIGELLTLKEVARLKNTTANAVYLWVRLNNIPPRRADRAGSRELYGHAASEEGHATATGTATERQRQRANQQPKHNQPGRARRQKRKSR